MLVTDVDGRVFVPDRTEELPPTLRGLASRHRFGLGWVSAGNRGGDPVLVAAAGARPLYVYGTGPSAKRQSGPCLARYAIRNVDDDNEMLSGRTVLVYRFVTGPSSSHTPSRLGPPHHDLHSEESAYEKISQIR